MKLNYKMPEDHMVEEIAYAIFSSIYIDGNKTISPLIQKAYNNLSEYDKFRVEQIYSRLVRNEQELQAEMNQRQKYQTQLISKRSKRIKYLDIGTFILRILLILTLFFMCSLAFCKRWKEPPTVSSPFKYTQPQPQPQLKKQPKEFFKNTNTLWQQDNCPECQDISEYIQKSRVRTQAVITDITGDGKINCQDYAITFFLIASINVRFFFTSCVINPDLGPDGHMFNVVECDLCGREIRVEPQGPLSDTFDVETFWTKRGYKYDDSNEYIDACWYRINCTNNALQDIVRVSFMSIEDIMQIKIYADKINRSR